MSEHESPSVAAQALHRFDTSTALAFVDSLFGPPTEWKSQLIRYRLSSEFQEDWKEEIGHWLKTAEQYGFLEPLRNRLLKRTKRGTSSTDVDPNDRRHSELVAELAPAMVVHYFVGTGWSFAHWEPVTGGDVDVDVQIATPSGGPTFLQVKAPDQPGRVVDHRRVDGEYDERVLRAIEKGASQLPKAGDEVKLVAVCANRTWPLSLDPRCVVVDLIGSTEGGRVVTLPKSRLGKFWTPNWKHVSGVVLLDYVRGGSEFRYACTVLLNPKADVPASADSFPYARVCSFDGAAFNWVRGEPGDAHTLPNGTLIDWTR